MGYTIIGIAYFKPSAMSSARLSSFVKFDVVGAAPVVVVVELSVVDVVMLPVVVVVRDAVVEIVLFVTNICATYCFTTLYYLSIYIGYI